MSEAGKLFGKNLDFRITEGVSSGSTANWIDISDWVQSVDGLPGEREMADVTCGGGAVAHEFLMGLQNADISITCLFDQASSGAYDVLSEYMDDTYKRYFAYYPAGATTDYPMIHGACRIKSLILAAKPLEAMTFTCSMVLDSTMTVTVCAT